MFALTGLRIRVFVVFPKNARRAPAGAVVPKKMKFGTSEGMILAAGLTSQNLWLLSPDEGAEPGMPIS